MNAFRNSHFSKVSTSADFFKEMSLLLRPDNVLFSTRFYTHIMYKKSNLFVYTFDAICQFFPNNSVRVYPIKLNIGMFYHMSNTFGNPVFKIFADVPLMHLHTFDAIFSQWPETEMFYARFPGKQILFRQYQFYLFYYMSSHPEVLFKNYLL